MTEPSPRREQPALCCTIAPMLEADDALTRATSIFKALSDETRLRILKALAAAGELCECNIVPSFGLSQPTISYHLKVLREAGLICSQRRGQWVYHAVNPKSILSAVRQLTEMA